MKIEILRMSELEKHMEKQAHTNFTPVFFAELTVLTMFEVWLIVFLRMR